MFNRKILTYLEQWKISHNRKPLILRGARQVGKTVSVQLFANKHFKNFIALNLEDPEQERLFRQPVSITEFEKIIQIKFNSTLVAGDTLLFIDEIQNSPALISLLRFFYEERPALAVIAAGSLLEVKLKKGGLSFPVGRVEFAYLQPLDFFEFLEARRENNLLAALKNTGFNDPLPPAAAEIAARFFNEYLMIGGMPEAVESYATEGNFQALNQIYNSLLTSYQEDIFKYASEAKAKYLTHCLENAPLFAGQTITYEHFGNSNYRSREMGEAFDTLEKAMLLHQTRGCGATALPLVAQRKKAPKLLFLDIGLVNYRLGIRDKIFEARELSGTFRGKIAEQVVGQHLLGLEPDRQNPIYYWYRDVPGSTAEIDYLLALQGNIIALEVKSGKSGRLRSLKEFIKMSGQKVAVRIHAGRLQKEIIHDGPINYELISLPFYLLPRLKEIILSA
ncbi:MAG: AAA family ATPase [bacterium]